MKRIEFLSESTYVMLPTKSDPKVYLPLDAKERVERAFGLYNPFSKKAKILKKVAKFLCLNHQAFAKLLLPTVEGRHSPFLNHLEEQLDKKILTSLYLATAKDKVVLQLQDDQGILGYVKFSISDVGKKRLANEQDALQLLAPITRVPTLLLNDTFKGTPFIMLENLEGRIGSVSASERSGILDSFKKKSSFKLSDHPRIKNLEERLEKTGHRDLIPLLGQIASASKDDYREVFEHGDFAPWNLIGTKSGVVPFDFEYFEENGLEYLDELKYHFQEQRLLNDKKGSDLISSLRSKTEIAEFDLLLRVFLIKEIGVKAECSESFTFERSLLALMDTSNLLS